jgi:hypothetical protein
MEERSLWYCSRICLETLMVTVKLSIRIITVLVESETRYVRNLYQHTQPDKQDSVVTGVKTRHITIQPLHYSFYILPHPNGIKKKKHKEHDKLQKSCSYFQSLVYVANQFIHGYVFWLQM